MKPIKLWRWICETGGRGNVPVYRATDPGPNHYGKDMTEGYFVSAADWREVVRNMKDVAKFMRSDGYTSTADYLDNLLARLDVNGNE